MRTYARAYAKTPPLLFCSNDLQRVSFVTQRSSVAASLIKGLFGKEQDEEKKNADSFSPLLVCAVVLKMLWKVLRGGRDGGGLSGAVSTPRSSLSP